MGEVIESVRRFNRFYTRRIGALNRHLADHPFNLTEARVLYELANRDAVTASLLCRDLDLDPAFLSRILHALEQRGFLARTRSDADGRKVALALTAEGRAAFEALQDATRASVAAMVAPLSEEERRSLLSAMEGIEALLSRDASGAHDVVLRPHRPGDMGWTVERHGSLYTQEYGWDERFEALVARIAAEFIETFDPRRERCWIAENRGRRVGSVLLVRQSDEVAKLRLLLVEPSARGLGVGKRLVEECTRFAREAGYGRITLWTQRNLTAARAIYEKAGYRLVGEEPHHSFGHDLIGETWELDLS